MINLFLFLVAALGGALNSVAGGGSFLTLPALLYAGVPPVAANATSTFAMWPASVSSAVAYRRDVKTPRSWLVILAAISLAGGFVGAVLLVRTSDARFMRLLPYLMLVAATTFTAGSRRRENGRTFRSGHRGSLALTAALHVPIAVYGGYFGGGMGIMMLATYALAGMTDIHEMNGLKAILGAAINGLALLDFIFNGIVAWQPGILMAAGGIIGGYGGAAIARRIDRAAIRVFVIVVGWTMTVYFFLR